MPWIDRNLKRSYRCNTRLIRFLRKRKEWTQEELAASSGLGKRVITKAELGGSMSPQSIDKIATALSDSKMSVFPEDLITDTVRLARAYMLAFHTCQSKMAQAISPFTDKAAVFYIAGNKQNVPFAGKHIGLAAFDDAMREYFGAFTVPNDAGHIDRYHFYPKGTEVIVWGESSIEPVGRPNMSRPMSMSLRLTFSRGRLVKVDDRYFLDLADLSSRSLPNYNSNPALKSKRKTELDDSHFDLEDSNFDLDDSSTDLPVG